MRNIYNELETSLKCCKKTFEDISWARIQLHRNLLRDLNWARVQYINEKITLSPNWKDEDLKNFIKSIKT